jgi:hypothetical protein
MAFIEFPKKWFLERQVYRADVNFRQKKSRSAWRVSEGMPASRPLRRRPGKPA